MLKTTVGQLVVNNAIPADLRNYNRSLDKKGVRDLLQQVAEKYPDQYRQIAKQLSTVGHEAATASGGFSFGLKSLRQTEAAKNARRELTMKLRGIYASDAPNDEKEKQIILTVGEHQKKLVDAVMEEATKAKNPLALQAISGARGNKMNVNSLLGADLLYADHRGKSLPIPVLRSYSMGLKPYEYFAGAFGARKGVIDLKCLSGDTLVVMADWSTRKICEIKQGEYVMGSDTVGMLRPVKVLNIFDNGKRTCYRWRFRVGSCRKRYVEVDATAEHKILAQVRAGRSGSTYAHRSSYTPLPLALGTARLQTKATKNEFVAWPARGEQSATTGVREHRALLLGLLLGDGYTPAKTGHTLSCADQLLIDDTMTYLASLNLKLNPPRDGYSHRLVEIIKSKQEMTVSNGRNSFAGTGNPVRKWLQEIGCVGKLAHEKQLPDIVWQWDRESVCQVIGGLIATDGTVEVRDDGCTVKFKLTSRQLVAQVQRLLELRLGVWCTPIRQIKAETIPLANYDQWEITFSHPEAVRRFTELVYVPGIKQRQLQEGLQRLSAEPRSAEIGFKIQSRTPIGEIQTFDIEVDHPDHLFLLDTGLVVSNSATQDAGFFAKQLVQATHRLLVSKNDDDNPYDETTPRGYAVATDDNDSEGSLLSHPVGGYARNTVLTPKILKELRANGTKEILVRSPIVGGPIDGGVYARDVGVRERGEIAPLGDYVGIAGAQALAEPVTQSQISSKHAGGIVGASAGAISGFKYINQLVQVPKVFQGGATHSQLDGRVTDIREAPQGGHFIKIEGKEHYAPHGITLKVKPGDVVEAGDVLTDGTPNPAEIVRHKGIGEGRDYFVKAFGDSLKDASTYGNRRNIELLARGLINHVRLTEEVGDYNPDDIVPYQFLESTWQPRTGHTTGEPQKLVGQYLEKPVLHYTVGTKIQPSMLPRFKLHNVRAITTHREPPPFEPEMIRGMANVHNDPDWLTRMLGSYQKNSLLDAVHRGDSSDTAGTSYVPALVHGADFGQKGLTKGWTSKPDALALPKAFG